MIRLTFASDVSTMTIDVRCHFHCLALDTAISTGRCLTRANGVCTLCSFRDGHFFSLENSEWVTPALTLLGVEECICTERNRSQNLGKIGCTQKAIGLCRYLARFLGPRRSLNQTVRWTNTFCRGHAVCDCVQNGTAKFPLRCHAVCMKRKEESKEGMSAVRAELAKPRVARSVRIAELRLDATRIAQPPSTAIDGTVDKIIPSRARNGPEKALIVLDGTRKRYRTISIANTLIDEHGADRSLKKGAHVEVTITTKDVNWSR